MAKLAVDIVLLPPKEIMDYAIGLNKELLKENPPEIVLGKTENCLPHISLDMGVMDKQNQKKIEEILEKIAENFSPLKLSIIGIESLRSSRTGEELSFIGIGKDSTLQELHEKLVNELKPYILQGEQDEIVWMDAKELPEEHAGRWVKNYVESSSFEKFWPHITLGVGSIVEKEKKTFTSTRLALCHLGNYCTCRKILAEFELKG